MDGVVIVQIRPVASVKNWSTPPFASGCVETKMSILPDWRASEATSREIRLGPNFKPHESARKLKKPPEKAWLSWSSDSPSSNPTRIAPRSKIRRRVEEPSASGAE